jgi:hypothetical protein
LVLVAAFPIHVELFAHSVWEEQHLELMMMMMMTMTMKMMMMVMMMMKTMMMMMMMMMMLMSQRRKFLEIYKIKRRQKQIVDWQNSISFDKKIVQFRDLNSQFQNHQNQQKVSAKANTQKAVMTSSILNFSFKIRWFRTLRVT